MSEKQRTPGEIINELEKIEKENKYMKQEHKIVIDEMIADYKKLEKENEELQKKYDEMEYEKKYNPIYEDGNIVKVTGNYGDDMTCVEQMIDELNELKHTRDIWMKYAKKMEKLLYEKIKPTHSDNVYLDIDKETGRCKYEHTHVCLDFNCDYYSTYFLNCRLMMGDKQLRKAKELGLSNDEIDINLMILSAEKLVALQFLCGLRP